MNGYEGALQQIEQLTSKIPVFPSTQITFDIRAKDVDEAEEIVEKICAAHDGKHKLNISVSLLFRKE